MSQSLQRKHSLGVSPHQYKRVQTHGQLAVWADPLGLAKPGIRAVAFADPMDGYNAISRVRITQTAPTGFAEGRVAFAHHKPEAPKTPDPAVQRQAAQVAGPVADSGLRDALERLAQNVLTKEQTKNQRHTDAASALKKG